MLFRLYHHSFYLSNKKKRLAEWTCRPILRKALLKVLVGLALEVVCQCVGKRGKLVDPLLVRLKCVFLELFWRVLVVHDDLFYFVPCLDDLGRRNMD